MKNFNIKQFYEWPLFARLIVIGIICLIIFYLGYFIDFSGKASQLTRIKQQEEDLKIQVISLVNNEAELKIELEKFPIFVKSLSEWQKKIITKDNLSELINTLLKIGSTNGLEFDSFNPGAEIAINEYIKVPIKAVVKGSYDQIATFISQVANMNFLVSIEDFALLKNSKNSTSDKAIKAEILLEIYERKNT